MGEQKIKKMAITYDVPFNKHSWTMKVNFTFMLPCITIDFFLNNQPDILIIEIYSVIKLYMFWTSSLPIIRSFPLYIQHW
jgi:hypothetical protein